MACVVPDYVHQVVGVKLTRTDGKGLGPEQTRLLRNAIFARHGRIFRSLEWDTLFRDTSWYKSRPERAEWSNAEWRAVLSDVDRHNLALIRQWEKALRSKP